MYSNKDRAFQILARRSIVLPVILMVLIVGVLSWLLQVTTTQASAINNSLAAIAQAESIQTLMIDVGDSWLNYKTTGDPLFQRAFTYNQSRIPGELASLRMQSEMNPATVARERQIEADLSEWRTAKTLVPPTLDSGPKSWRLILNLKLNQIRGDVGSLVAAEHDLLSAQVDRQRALAIVLFVALGGGALLVATILSYQSWKTLKTLSGRYEGALAQATEKSAALEIANAELDRRVEERTSALNRVNQELEVFCYSAAHDLRAPLRWIISSTRIFIDDYGSLVPEEGLEQLRRVTGAGTRLSNLIDSLLEMARLGRVELNVSSVDLSEICNRSATEIQSRVWPGAVSISIEPDMRVDGDPLLLSLLVQNLIENAIKFSCGAGDGKVEINSLKADSEVVVTVRDNGVGFDEAHADKLFTPLERLHSDAEFSGTGMGLANAKRIVDRHGGRIWAESKPGQGATFRFALPMKSAAKDLVAG